MTKRMNQTDDGFTLVELLTVTLIIGILAAIVIPMWFTQRSKASAADAASDLRNTATFEEAHYADYGSYSSSLSALGTDGLQRTANIKLGIAVSANGYCEVAQAGPSSFLWFDSGAGGVQRGKTTTLVPPTSANGVCTTAVPTAVA